jgi:hypothetical protein
MKQFLAVLVPIVVTFAFWSVITLIPMPGFLLLVLVVASGVLMPFGMVYLGKKADSRP